jgi:uncharacterized protein (TIGR00255 family)
MFNSMTAYAAEECSKDNVIVSVEIRAYNSRHLDIALRLPGAYVIWEERIKRMAGEQVTRGRIEMRLKIKDLAEVSNGFEVDWAKARAYHQAARNLKKTLKLQSPITWDQIATVPGVIQTIENPDAAETHWPLAADCLHKALIALNRMRHQEGEYILKDVLSRLGQIDQGLSKIAQAAGHLPESVGERLRERIETLMRGTVEVDPARLAQEIAILADRSDISEEIVRAGSHMQQFRAIIQGAEPAGRKLNFLLQELNREFNTIGAKVAQADIAHIIVDIKAEIERLREQIQNIE